jgi:Tubulin like
MNVRPDEFNNVRDVLLEAERPRAVTEPRINTPTIVVFLGSTATLAALELMRHMLTLNQNDIRRVALVYIDTDDLSSGLVEFRHQHNGIFQEFPLRIAVPAGIPHVKREEQPVCVTLSDPDDMKLELHTFIKNKEPQYFANGAGGIRNNGHVAACFHHQQIYDTLDRALVTVSRVDSTQGGKRINEVQVNIVSFLGGGTGSGILPDIAVMVRDLLTNYQYRQRINLFCTLPEPVKGASLTDISWRKSNATACLLELLALSGAAAGPKAAGIYKKLMRDKVYRLTNDPIANEIYLIGHASMDDTANTARIVGLDVFQRITDASGVGFLEHSKWVDRRTLGETDDKGLPTVFGTSCPLEVRFPATETADAFARIAASHLLPFLAKYEPGTPIVHDNDKRDWTRKWNDIARIDANVSDPNAIRLGQLNYDEFVQADQRQLDMLWSKLGRYERETERRIKEVIILKQKEERRRIDEAPQTVDSDDDASSLINLRVQHLLRLQQEYNFAIEMLASRETPTVPARPTDVEADLVQPGGLLFRLKSIGRDHAYEVYSAYNEHMGSHALAVRHRSLVSLLEELLQTAQERHDAALNWFKETNIDDNAQEIGTEGITSMAWQGHLENPHPHQRHIFDLRTLRSSDGRNIAVERFYLWATGGDKALTEGTPIKYERYVSQCVDYLARKMNDPRSKKQGPTGIEQQSAGRLADQVVDFFRSHYLKMFQDMNLIELLEKAAPPSPKGQPRIRQISNYLLEHLQHVRGLMSSLVAFEAELWAKGSATLDTSIYLGIHWRDSYQRDILEQTLDDLGPITSRGQVAMVEAAIDPHRLQVVYGQHAISLSTVRDFYLDQNSSMEAYMFHQKKWEDAGGALLGLMPVHSSSEAQWLVRDGSTLGYTSPPTPLYKRVIREPFMP